MVVLLVHVRANSQSRQRVCSRQQVELERGDGPIYHNLPEIPDKQIEGIEQERALHCIAVAVNRIEDGGHPHDELGQYPPQVLHVPEEHEQRGEDQPHPQIEHNQTPHRIHQQQKLPGKRNAVNSHKGEENQQRQAEINQRRHVLGQQEQILRHVHFGKNPRVAHQRVHPQIGGVRKVGEHQLPRKQVHHIVVHIVSKEVAEHHPHNQQVHQRRQDAPGHAQDGPLVLLREISLHQLAEQELMLFQFLQYHSVLFTPAPAIHAGYPREYPPKEFAAASRCRLSAWCGRSR